MSSSTFSSTPVNIPSPSNPPASTAGTSTSAVSPSPASLKLITSLEKLASYGTPGSSFKIKEQDIEWAAQRWENGLMGLTAEGSIKKRSQQDLRAKRSDGAAGERVTLEQHRAGKQNNAPHATTTVITTSASVSTTDPNSAGHTLTASASQISLASLPSLAPPSYSRTASASSSVLNTPFSPATDLPEFTPVSSAVSSVSDLRELGSADIAGKCGSPATSAIGLNADRAEGALFVRKRRLAVEPMTPLRLVLEVPELEAEEEVSEGDESSVVESGEEVEHEMEEGGAEADMEDAGEDVCDDVLSETESWASAITHTPRRQLAYSLYTIPDDHPYAQDAHVSGWSNDEGGWGSDGTHVDSDSAEEGDDEDEEGVDSGEEEDADLDGNMGDVLSEEDFEGMDDEVEEVDSPHQPPRASSPARSFSSSLFAAPGDPSDGDDDEDAQGSRPPSSDEESDLASLIPISPWAVQTLSTSLHHTISRPARSASTPTPLPHVPILRPPPRRLTLPPRSMNTSVHPSPPPSPQLMPAGPYPMFDAVLPTYERDRPIPLRMPVFPLNDRWEAVHLGGASGAGRTEKGEEAEREAMAEEEWYRAEEAKLKEEEEDAARLRRHLEELGVYV